MRKRGLILFAFCMLGLPGATWAYTADPALLRRLTAEARTNPTLIAYRGNVRWYIADLKTSFPEHQRYSAQTALTAANYRAVLDGLKNNAKVNGVRLPIFPSHTGPEQYSALYRNIYSYARQLGLLIYASPMSVGMTEYSHWTTQQYAAWLAAYTNYFAPEVLSPFNETGSDNAQLLATMQELRPLLKTSTLLSGPDRQHVKRTLADLSRDPDLAAQFDIIDSHNAASDRTATQPNWARLVSEFGRGKPVWASENPANWDAGVDPSLPGLVEAVDGGAEAIVIWAAKPSLVDDEGRPTQKALDIAAHLAQ